MADLQSAFGDSDYNVTRKGEFSAIPKQVYQHLLQTLIVRLNELGHLMGHCAEQKNFLFQPHLNAQQFIDLLNQNPDFHLLDVRLKLSALKLRVIQRVVDQTEKELRGTLANFKLLHCDWVNVRSEEQQ